MYERSVDKLLNLQAFKRSNYAPFGKHLCVTKITQALIRGLGRADRSSAMMITLGIVVVFAFIVVSAVRGSPHRQ
jgi:hypothetical protein